MGHDDERTGRIMGGRRAQVSSSSTAEAVWDMELKYAIEGEEKMDVETQGGRMEKGEGGVRSVGDEIKEGETEEGKLHRSIFQDVLSSTPSPSIILKI